MESRKREREREVSCDVPEVAYLQVREWRVVILVHRWDSGESSYSSTSRRMENRHTRLPVGILL